VKLGGSGDNDGLSLLHPGLHLLQLGSFFLHCLCILTRLATTTTNNNTLPSPCSQPFLDAQLAAAAAGSSSSEGDAEQQQQQQQPPFTKEDLSTALLATVATLPDLVEDVPKSPVLVAEVIGHFLAAGQLSFGLAELAAAVKEAGADGGEQQEGDAEDPPLVDSEKAAPMLLVTVNAVKVGVRGGGRGGEGDSAGFVLGL